MSQSIPYGRAPRQFPFKASLVYADRKRRHFNVNGGESGTYVSHPTKGDTPLQHYTTVEGFFDETGLDFDSPAPIPTRAIRTTMWKHSFVVISARSKRELRQSLESNNTETISNIQIADNGRYFVYVNNLSPQPNIAEQDCVTETPHKIEDIVTPVDEDCVTETPNQVEPSPTPECETQPEE